MTAANQQKRTTRSLYALCMAENKLHLLQEWHPVKNGDLTPRDIAGKSSKNVWWICSKGHEWNCSVWSRSVRGSGCPFCSNHRILTGFNDMATTHPQLAAQWHPTKNGELTPENVMAKSHFKVWWLCGRGHEWQATVYSRANGAGCPVCANRRIIPGYNDFATTHPELAKQWHPSKNEGLTPEQISFGYDKKVWWICEHGHAWQASPISRVKEAAGCPVCSNHIAQAGVNDLATTHPYIAAQWHPTKNGNLRPWDVVGGSSRVVWWQCRLGHQWRARIADRTHGTNNCPYCANQKVLAGFNDLATVFPDIAAQWHPTLNEALTPEMVTPGSSRRVWWICPEGHVWRTAVCNRAGKTKRTGCPVCAGNARVKYRQNDYARCFGQTAGKQEDKQS